MNTAAIAHNGITSNQRTPGYVAAYTQMPPRKSVLRPELGEEVDPLVQRPEGREDQRWHDRAGEHPGEELAATEQRLELLAEQPEEHHTEKRPDRRFGGDRPGDDAPHLEIAHERRHEHQLVEVVDTGSVDEHRCHGECAHDVGRRDVESAEPEPAVVRASSEHRGDLIGHQASPYRPLRMLEASWRNGHGEAPTDRDDS